MEFQLSYFTSWKMMLWKCCTQYVSKFEKLSSGHSTGKGQFSFQSPRKAMPKNAQTTAWLIALISHSSKVMIKISKPVNPCPLSWWCHPAISSSVVPFSSCLQSFPASESFPVIQFFTSGGQSIGVSASASVLPMNIQDWLPLGWTGWISLQSKGLSTVFFNLTVQKHQFFGASFLYSPTLHTWLLKKP